MSRAERKPANILLLMSGSIACAKASMLVSEWVRRGHRVRVVCTRSVAEFVGPATLQGLGAESVFSNVFEPGQAMQHIELGKWADLIVAAPATSNLINKLAAGIADDAVTTVWQAAYGQDKPMLIAPAMNTRMWRYPATSASVERLRQWGIRVLPVGSGDLACGESGEGRLLEPADLLQQVDRLLAFVQKQAGPAKSGQRVLITAGGTREPIDSVRYIGNFSTGRTAAALADELAAAGHDVTWLGAADAAAPNRDVRSERYTSFADLEQGLRELLGKHHFDAVIHAAAVSDFGVAAITTESGAALDPAACKKLPSDAGLLLHLKRNPKLLDSLKGWSMNPEIKVIGFKLTDDPDAAQQLEAVRKQFATAAVDAVAHNDLAEISTTAHPFNFHRRGQDPLRCEDTGGLARAIESLLEPVR